MLDSKKFGDLVDDTLGHIAEEQDKFVIPNLHKMDIANEKIKGKPHAEKPLGYQTAIKEQSVGRDTMTCHWELNYYFIVSL